MGPEQAGLLAPLLAFVVAWSLTRQFCRADSRLHFLDHPNERSLHARPVPRTGGVGVMTGVAAAGALIGLAGGVGGALPGALGGALGLAALGLVDDRRGLPARVRLFAQVLAAGVFLLSVRPAGGLLEGVLLLLGLVWMANLYNFMDGSDGLAGGMAVSGFATLAWAALADGQFPLAQLCAAVAAAAAGFLCFNFHPARIFMGDAGSVPLGFLAAALGITGREVGAWPLWFPLLVFSPFVMDATATLLRRALRGEKVWEAHRSHYYQRLVRMGAGHRRTALAAYGLMVAAGCSAMLALPMGFSLQCGVITMWLMIYVFVGWRIDCAWRRHEAAK